MNVDAMLKLLDEWNKRGAEDHCPLLIGQLRMVLEAGREVPAEHPKGAE